MSKMNLVITGVSSEIGIEVANRVASASNVLLVTSRKTEVDGFKPNFPKSVYHLQGLDLTRETDTLKVSHVARELFNKPFCWLHCAGSFWRHKSLEDTSLEEAVTMIMSHYVTLYATAKVLIPEMKQVKGGRILALSCNSVRYNYPEMAAFTSAKAAVECLIRCIANEYLKDNVLANCIALPTVATPTVKSLKLEQYHKYYIELDKLVDAIINMFVNMSPFVTGNVLSIVKHSPFFYTEGYYTRNREQMETNLR